MISEATCVAKEGHGYRQVPGIYTQEQIEVLTLPLLHNTQWALCYVSQRTLCSPAPAVRLQ